MPSAVENLVNGYNTDSPVSFYDYYNAYGLDKWGTTGFNRWYRADPNGLGGRINNFFTGEVDSARQAYENYLAEFEHRRNLKLKEAEWSREDSAVQRAVADIKAAGLNPWLALNGGSMNSAVNASQSEPVRYKAKEAYLKSKEGKDKTGALVGAAVKILTLLAIFG